MIARAPGKLVLSGAYSVLEGAPALVAAVDRYVVADGAERPELETPEVLEAVARGHLPAAVGFDASALRRDGRKLGLGSSAAILVASMATASTAPDDDLGASLFPAALAAHRAAQGGGSGVDVAAACFGGVVQCRLRDDELHVTPHALPSALEITCWACPSEASTRAMLAAVNNLAAREPRAHADILRRARGGAEAAVVATDVAAFVAAIEAQRLALAELGRRAGVPIVTPEVDALAPLAHELEGSFAPSGAGGGDVALLFRRATGPGPLADFRARAERVGLIHVAMQVGATGVHRVRPSA